MAKQGELNSGITNFQVDMDADIAQRQRAAADAGVDKSDDLLQGRIDNATGVEDDIHPYLAEKLVRDKEFADLADQEPKPQETQAQAEERVVNDRISELERQYEGAVAESRKWKTVSGRWKDKASNHEKRLAELEARVGNPAQLAPQMVDTRQLLGRDPNDTLTAQEVVALMMSQSAAFGNELQSLKAQALKAQESKERTSAVSDLDEAELIYSHPWLENLPEQQRERAMIDIMGARKASPTPPPPTPPQPNLAKAENERARIREANFIETSTRSSRAEQVGQDPAKIAYQDKLAKLQEALNKPGGSREADAILTALGSGANDNAEATYFRRR